MKKARPIPAGDERGKQVVPVDICGDLLAVMRRQFFPDSFSQDPAVFKRWKQDEAWLKRNVVLWPAAWLNRRGITLKPERYKEIILGVMNEIKIHGKTGAVGFWPGYLMKCVQSHFRHHEDEIYAEGKSLRTQLERVIATAQNARASAPDPIKALAAAQQVLAGQRKQKLARPAGLQMEMF